mmetsp:Transcript_39170/g.64489  ORF Transcript_39170/g.64489 Transcript_39170/m.64489 type:complete len:169 (+) Transcript_39170:1-507(+)
MPAASAPAAPAAPSAAAPAAAASSGGSYLDNVVSAGSGKAAPASTLKAEVSNTRTVGASGSYFDSMGGAATAPAGKSAAATPASKPAAPVSTPASPAKPAAPISTPATPASNAASSSPAEMPAAVAEDMEVDAKALTLGGAILVVAGVAYEFFTGAFSSLAGQFSGNN